jgi:hypothetical protein
VHEIAKSGTGTLPHLILPATSFSEISYWTQLRVDWPTTKPSVVQIVYCFLSIFFPSELNVYVAHQMVTQIIAYIHFLDFPVLIFTFYEHILKEIVIMFLHFFITHMVHLENISSFSGVLWIDVNILKNNRLTKGRFIVDPGAPIPMSASSDFEIKRAVYLVLFGTEN